MWKHKCSGGHLCLLRMTGVVLILTPWAHAADRSFPSPEAKELLQFIPDSTVSVFCVDTTIKVRRWVDDLTQLTAFQTAACFTTMLAQTHTDVAPTRVSVLSGKFRCVVSATRNIQGPKSSPGSPVANGPFRSERCELFMVPWKVERQCFEEHGKEQHVRTVRMASCNVLEIPVGDEKLWMVQLTDRIICVSNHQGYLLEVLQLAHPEGQPRPKGMDVNATFRVAMSCITPDAAFWGIRRFGHLNEEKDPTSLRKTVTPDLASLRDAHGIASSEDLHAVFVACDLAKPESSGIQFHYGSEDPIAATNRYPAYLGQCAKVTSGRTAWVASPSNPMQKWAIHSMKVDLTQVVLEGMDEPSVVFPAICTVFGQGMQL